MNTHKYIPFPELRRQYRKQRKRKQEVLELIQMSVLAIFCGAVVGLMAAGIWVTL